MKEIPLTKGKTAIVDDDVYEFVNQWKWHISKGYASRWTSMVGGKREAILMHRIIMNNPDGYVVDHINGNRLDNRKENLRVCTENQNKFNRKPNKNSSSKFKGVSWSNKDKSWRTEIHVDNKRIYLGMYKNEIEAALKYNEAALKYHGEFAYLNEIPRIEIEVELYEH